MATKTRAKTAASAPQRLAAMGIRIGTASWTDKSLLSTGRFYPDDVKSPEERLRFYASVFPFVEVDSTYYTANFESQATAWAERTPDDFIFDVKAFRMLTLHQTPHKMLPAEVRDAIGEPPEGKRNWYYKDLDATMRDDLWRTFERSLAPLQTAKKIGAVIFQLPPWAMPSPESQAHLQECADRLDGYRVAVEFRNKYWLSDRNRRRTLAFLRENGMAYVIVDEPQGFRSSVPLLWEVTDPQLAILRLHGRNAETWEKKGLPSAAERFNYLYSEEELSHFADPVREMKRQAKEIHATFNNNYEDYPQRNAAEFAKMLV
jgi:uncharacterized protein YecE (DUF72 family)